MSAFVGPGLGSSRPEVNPGGADPRGICRCWVRCKGIRVAAVDLGCVSGSVWPPLYPLPALAVFSFAAGLRLPDLTSCQGSFSEVAGSSDKG